METGASGGVENHGISSLYDPDGIAPPLHFKAARIRHPFRKIMLVDERSQSDDGKLNGNPDDGRWTPSTNPNDANQITKRHNKRGAVAMADGQVDLVVPKYGNVPLNFDPLR